MGERAHVGPWRAAAAYGRATRRDRTDRFARDRASRFAQRTCAPTTGRGEPMTGEPILTLDLVCGRCGGVQHVTSTGRTGDVFHFPPAPACPVCTTAEQSARDMLERMGVEDAQSFTSGDLVELANLIAERDRLRTEVDRLY